MTKVLVTGGAGFIGSHLATSLVKQGHDVKVLDNLCTGELKNLSEVDGCYEFCCGDVGNEQDVAYAVRNVEVVFHQAALASVPLSVEHPERTHNACATGTLNVLRASVNEGVRRVVYAGSSSAYGNHPQMPKREDMVPEVLSPYAAAKLTGELYCESFAATYGIETVRLRYFNVYGPRQDPNSPYSAVIPLFISALVMGDQPHIFGDGLQSRDFVYVKDVVQANLLASQAENVSGKVFNVATGSSISLIELLEEICRQMKVEYNPIFDQERPGDVKHSWADISAAAEHLGYTPETDLKSGLQETIQYYLLSHTQSNSPSPSIPDSPTVS